MKEAIASAPPIAAPGAGPDVEALRAAYLGVLKLVLCDLGGSTTGTVQRTAAGEMVAKQLHEDWMKVRALGLDWPQHGLTMVGLERLDDLQACIESVVADGVEGDLIEAGSWRGGASIFARATLDSLGAHDRTVFVADSFKGFPAGTEEADLEAADFLAVPEKVVRESFARFGCDQGVELLPGFFEKTLPPLAGREKPWAIVRLDGDSHRATKLALEALYPRLAVGGYLIVDDYRAFNECSAAVDAFRAEHGIEEPLERVDWTCARWRRESAAAIDVPAPPRPARVPGARAVKRQTALVRACAHRRRARAPAGGREASQAPEGRRGRGQAATEAGHARAEAEIAHPSGAPAAAVYLSQRP